MSTWLPIESNPEVMNKLLHRAGMSKKWSIFDVYGLDDDLLLCLNQPVIAMLLLFPINQKYVKLATDLESKVVKDGTDGIYYMKQTVSNACGTVALAHALANNLDKVTLEEGSLKRFFEASKDKTPEERAFMLDKNEEITQVHDDVAREGDTPAPPLDANVEHHFVVFVEKNGKLYELDGRKSGPLCYGEIKDSFLKSSAAAIKRYMENDPENIQFNMLALAPTEG